MKLFLVAISFLASIIVAHCVTTCGTKFKCEDCLEEGCAWCKENLEHVCIDAWTAGNFTCAPGSCDMPAPQEEVGNLTMGISDPQLKAIFKGFYDPDTQEMRADVYAALAKQFAGFTMSHYKAKLDSAPDPSKMGMNMFSEMKMYQVAMACLGVIQYRAPGVCGFRDNMTADFMKKSDMFKPLLDFGAEPNTGEPPHVFHIPMETVDGFAKYLWWVNVHPAATFEFTKRGHNFTIGPGQVKLLVEFDFGRFGGPITPGAKFALLTFMLSKGGDFQPDEDVDPSEFSLDAGAAKMQFKGPVRFEVNGTFVPGHVVPFFQKHRFQHSLGNTSAPTYNGEKFGGFGQHVEHPNTVIVSFCPETPIQSEHIKKIIWDPSLEIDAEKAEDILYGSGAASICDGGFAGVLMLFAVLIAVFVL